MALIRDEDIRQVVADMIGDTASDFDIDAIVRECFRWAGDGFTQSVSESDFWACVARHEHADRSLEQ